MSEFHPQVVRLGKVGKNPNADSLSITTIAGYPVQFTSTAFQAGDLAVHIPIDAVVDTSLPAFNWLADKASNGLYRVKAAKLRGIPSYGFLVPISELPQEHAPYTEGQDVRTLLNIKKYDPGPCYDQNGVIQGEHFSLPEEGVVPLYDIEGLRKYQNLFTDGEQVVITEKLHGSNGRWANVGGKFFCGSRTKFRENSVWNRIADKYNLQSEVVPGLVLYGEVIGPGIQDLTYGLTEVEARFFDIYDTNNGKWLDAHSFIRYCTKHGLPTVPVLHEGPFDLQQSFEMAEGKSTLPTALDQVREGIVIKPVYERWDQTIGRVFLKLPGEGYLLRKGG